MSLIGKNIGNYQIKAKLGEGGMGAVYLGEHPLIGKRVAVKVLLEELAAKEDIVNRFFNEAKAVNDIGHQNIVDIVDFGKTKSAHGSDIVYFIMEFLDGESLAGRLRRTGLGFRETMHVIAQCCSALAASHQKGIVHRDLKPENIYLCTRGPDKHFVKILDFGIAKLTGDGGQSSHKTRTGLVIGTPAYMSPEQCEGKGLIDHRSDVYSLGVVMYELLTGRVPFPGEGFGEILVAHLTRPPELPSSLNPDIKPEIEAIVLHAIEKDRNRRFQTMDEFLAAVLDPATHLQSYSPIPGYTPTVTGSRSGGTLLMDGSGSVSYPLGQMGPITGSGPRPTTLSGAAGEVGGGAARSRAPIFVAAAAGVILVGAGGGFLALRSKAPTVVIEQQGVTSERQQDENVKITVTSDPLGARVFRADTGGYEPGKTPLSFTVKRGSPPTFDIQVKLEGFKSAMKSLSTDRDQAILVPLEKDATAQAAPPAEKSERVENTENVAKPETAVADKSGSSTRRRHTERKAKAETGDTKGGGDDMKLLLPKF